MDDWVLPRRKPITRAVIERAIAAEGTAAAREHQAQAAWFDRRQGTVMVKLTDGRELGIKSSLIPSLQAVSAEELNGLTASDDGLFLVMGDLHIDVDGLVTRIEAAGHPQSW